MKKLIAILLCAIALTAVSACGGQSSAPTEATVGTAAQTEAETEAETKAAVTKATETAAPTSAISAPESERAEPVTEAAFIPTESESEQLLVIETGGRVFYADFEDNSSAEALKENLRGGSITLSMRDYGGFEKVGDLPFSLVTNDEEITTSAGDVILYQGSQLTIYYDVNTWRFTRVAKIRGADGSLKEQLGEGDINVTLSLG
ncbi:MAG: hypothetical protein IJI48_02595 [Ruminococcus sp.]|nr:hypothetical protein [Ruminococcus sp.]